MVKHFSTLRGADPSDILKLFDEQTIRELAMKAGLPSDADLVKFGEGVRHAAEAFREAGRPPSGEVEIAKLHSLAECVSAGGPEAEKAATELAEGLHKLSQDTGRRLRMRSEQRSVPTPTAATIEDPNTRQKAATQLARLLSFGGRRSGRTFKPYLCVPKPKRGRPQDIASLYLVAGLWGAYWEATARRPPLTAHHAEPGPFVRLVRACLERLGAANVDAVEAAKRYGKFWKRPGLSSMLS
jgi:hypothetical protein